MWQALHGGIISVLQTQFSSFSFYFILFSINFIIIIIIIIITSRFLL